MKSTLKQKVAAALAVIVIGFAVIGLRATTQVFIGSMYTVNNTTSNAPSFLVTTSAIPKGTFWLQNAGLSNTNALVVNVQISADNTNFLTIATYRPARTNATTEAYSPTLTVPLYMRGQIITTNSVQVGGTWTFP